MQTSQTYPQMTASMRVKFARYTAAQCAYAIADCHETMRLNPAADAAYVAKLWAEIDAARERAAKLARH